MQFQGQLPNAAPNFFEAASQTIKIKDLSEGSVYPQEANPDGGVFYLDRLGDSPSEQFALGLVIRVNDKPIRLVTEKYLRPEELNSFDQGQAFDYTRLNQEL